MKPTGILFLLASLTFAVPNVGRGTNTSAAANTPPAQSWLQPPAARVVDLKTSDGTILKASYFAAASPGPGVILCPQSNRTRKSWDDVAGQLAAAIPRRAGWLARPLSPEKHVKQQSILSSG